MADKVVIRAEDVGKRYGKLHALRDINLEVNRGEIFGLIGPDGAGKTTLFRLVATLLTPDSGSLTVLGHDVVKQFRTLRKQIGYMPGRFSLYHDLTVEENLNFYATVFGTTVKENYALIADVYSQIEPFRKRLAGTPKGGPEGHIRILNCRNNVEMTPIADGVVDNMAGGKKPEGHNVDIDACRN